MMTLYDLTEEEKELYNLIESGEAIDLETGEIDAGVAEQLAFNKRDYEKKVDNIVCYIKSLDALAEGIKQEKEKLAKRQQSTNKKIESLKRYLDMNLKLIGRTEVVTARSRITYRNTSGSVEILDEKSIPEQYCSYERKISKSAISDALKQGIEVPGAKLNTEPKLQIN